MHQAPASEANDLLPFKRSISLPYRLTPGKSTGTFLAELAAKRIIGTRCTSCGRVEVPAQDVCRCGHDGLELVQVGEQGTLQGFTQTPEHTLALVRLDGADVDLMHRLVGDPPSGSGSGAGWQVGLRVAAVWADTTKGSIMDLAGFSATSTASTTSTTLATQAAAGAAAAAKPVTDLRQPLDSIATSLSLHYEHARGPYYGRLFDEMQTSGRIVGIRCPSCHSVLLPPRELCDVCYVRTGTWVDVADTGVLQAFSIIHLKFVGQFREPPYIYAEIVLDGASTKIIHTLDGVDIERAPKHLKPGARVRAVWKAELKGSLDDISHFELIDPLPAD